MTFEELKRVLFVRGNVGMKLGLERMRAALALLGDPHLCAPVLHVAGTNGKGSTCAFAAEGLRAAGLRVGFYSSPHLVHFCERIRVGGVPVSEERAAALLQAILDRVPWALEGGPAGRGDGDGLTFFELATLMGFLAFAEAGVQAMVVEVGLGGRLDATNVVRPLACAIAPLGLEHQQYLGDTLELIAAEKAGIVKRGAPVATADQAPEAMAVLEQVCAERGAPLWRPGRDYRVEAPAAGTGFAYRGRTWTVEARLSLSGAHQRQNAALACALLELAAERGLAVSPAAAAEGLSRTSWPGRLQQAGEWPLVLLDGAHNPHATAALAAALPALLGGLRAQLVFGTLADKDAVRMLAPLVPLCAGAHFCPPASPRAAAASQLAAAAREAFPGWPVQGYPDAAQALAGARAAAGASGAVLCCGSLYLVGELLERLGGRAPAAMPAERL